MQQALPFMPDQEARIERVNECLRRGECPACEGPLDIVQDNHPEGWEVMTTCPGCGISWWVTPDGGRQSLSAEDQEVIIVNNAIQVLAEMPRFVQRCQQYVDDDHPRSGANGGDGNDLTLDWLETQSPRFARVHFIHDDDETPYEVFCFVEKATGDVYKAKSFHQAAHTTPARGNVFSDIEDGLGVYWGGARPLR